MDINCKIHRNGAADLEKFNSPKDLNILYIAADGIETCGGDPVEAAEKLKDSNSQIILGIIGFNVDANQDKLLRQIAQAAGGHYSSANEASKLTSQLQMIHELAFSQYKWEPFTEEMYKKIADNHKQCLFWNDNLLKSQSLSEALDIQAALHVSNISSYDLNITKFGGQVDKKIREMAKQRDEKIKSLYTQELQNRQKESEEYLNDLSAKIGQTAAFIPMTSRINPNSPYYSYYDEGRNKTSDEEQQESIELMEKEEDNID